MLGRSFICQEVRKEGSRAFGEILVRSGEGSRVDVASWQNHPRDRSSDHHSQAR
jgi:hypothetical protein